MVYIRSFFMFCVPLFLLLTGYLNCHKKPERSHYKKLGGTLYTYVAAALFGLYAYPKLYGAVTIGRCVMMGTDVTIITRQHRTDRTDVPMMDQGFEPERPVVIGDDVWIGDRVTILPGVTVGDGCIIGAGAVVTCDLPPLSVAAGVPARVIRTRDEGEGECL